jgi:hypothetical protein
LAIIGVANPGLKKNYCAKDGNQQIKLFGLKCQILRLLPGLGLNWVLFPGLMPVNKQCFLAILPYLLL